VIRDALEETGLTDRREPDKEEPFDEKLRKLHKLHEEGILTDEEYETEKRRILDNA